MNHSLVYASSIATIGALVVLVVATQLQNRFAGLRLALVSPSSSPTNEWGDVANEWSALANEWNSLALALANESSHDYDDEGEWFYPPIEGADPSPYTSEWFASSLVDEAIARASARIALAYCAH